MDIWSVVFVVFATLWGAGVFFGLFLPDKISKKVLVWLAEVEHQPYWWLPVGLISLGLFIYGIAKSVDFKIRVNWAILLRSVVFLIGVVIFALIWIFIRRRKNKNPSSSS